MTFLPSPAPTHAPIAVPVVETRPQLNSLLENIAQLQRERDQLHRAQESEIGAVRQRYRIPLAEIDHYLELESSWAEAWARRNPGVFGAERSFSSAQVTIGFRADPLRIERASRRWTWSRIAATLATLPWGAPLPAHTRRRSRQGSARRRPRHPVARRSPQRRHDCPSGRALLHHASQNR